MTPQEKAKELVYKYFNLTDHMQFEEAKQCALIAVDEILNAGAMYFEDATVFLNYYEEVKQEIEKL